jgi:hypothetical protein
MSLMFVFIESWQANCHIARDEVSLAEHESKEGAAGSISRRCVRGGAEWRLRMVCNDLHIDRHAAPDSTLTTGKEPAPCARAHV